ncbi:MAG TPA: ATP-binding cassette domain-containing protein [Syntrophales bacterium]|jgi:biotin transport system ATP-binding protein/energy-coupling factor transport system ATP-binding protein|nr:ATP-binding cassette domain-containing protein [Syntrophales bacterium]HON23998.1 ATP-binding cassette domain-containing protein [Syntrophales bacterium]HOU78702.1 ATP-binding cassette domain-containing protein [Syntrophales bacterium]HPC33737.1 ATP-binding cassette domain-containing protein [Syntrophales bacterium]HQG35032.1 ATP-binding cassette domain-containing protein [Syntrophales bacterium]
MIELREVFYQYGERHRPVLEGVSLQIPDGQYVAIIGPNGCGKTTLIKHLNALLLPSRGEICVDGLNTRDVTRHRELRCRVGMVFQNPDHQVVGMSVEEDVAFGLENLAVPPREIAARIGASLARVGLAGFEQRAPFTLSGGEKRLVSLAGVLVMNPRWLVLDEPTAYLDPSGRRRVLAMIAALHREGMGIIHVTHDLGEVADAERVLVMERGAVVRDGTPGDVCTFLMSGATPGLEAPVLAALMARLKESGWNLRTDVVSLEAAHREIHSCLARLAVPTAGGNK